MNIVRSYALPLNGAIRRSPGDGRDYRAAVMIDWQICTASGSFVTDAIGALVRGVGRGESGSGLD